TMFLVVALCSFFVWHTLFLLSKKSQSMSGRTRFLQRKLTHTLMLQISVPLTVQIGPMAVVSLSAITGWLTAGYINGILCIQMLHCTLHTTILIATTPTYRHAL
ncbi:hypothetical protein PFISCL1PPCAC_13568, partial [Pristionchus fissidentatus]